MSENLHAVILAGGRGKRMGSLCNEIPKPFLPFAGSHRVIDFCLSNCLHSRIARIVVMVDYQRKCVTEYLQSWQASTCYPSDMVVLPPQKGSYSGTANAVFQNLQTLSRHNGPVLIMAADHIYKMDYRKMLAFHENTNADLTIAVIPVPWENASQFGILTADKTGHITAFAEKPVMPQSNLASMGIYIFKRSKLFQRLFEDAVSLDSAHDFGRSIIQSMVGRDRVFAYQFSGYWRDIGTVKGYYAANMEVLDNAASLCLEDDWPVFTSTVNAPSLLVYAAKK